MLIPAEILAFVRRWWRLTALYVVAAGLLALIVGLFTTPVYLASTILVVAGDTPGISTSDYSDLLTNEALANTYSEMLNKRPLLERVVADLDLPMDARQLKKNVRVSVVRDTHLVSLSVEDSSPERAIAIVNGIAKQFTEDIRDHRADQYTALKNQLQAELDKVKTQLEATEARLASLDSIASPDVLDARDQLNDALAQGQANYQSLFKSYLDANVNEARAGEDLVAAEAQASTSPIKPQILQNLVLATMVGFIISLVVAFVVERLDDSIKTPDDIARTVGVPALGTVAHLDASDAESLVTLASPNSRAAEAFGVLRTNLEFAQLDSHPRTLLVTSPNPQEGKSLAAANLAVAIAQHGKRVILVDANLRPPVASGLNWAEPKNGRVASILSNSPLATRHSPLGLSAALIGRRSSVGEHLVGCEVDRLLFMPGGPLPPNPAELLQSRRMAQVVKQLAALADLVIFDGPALEGMSDAVGLTQVCDAALIVAKAGSTRKGALKNAAALFAHSPCRLLGVVLNSVPALQESAYYYYYSGDGDDQASPKHPMSMLQQLLNTKPVHHAG